MDPRPRAAAGQRGLFAVFFGGMTVSGWDVYNSNQVEHGQSCDRPAGVSRLRRLPRVHFRDWESEFLQMGMYVVLTAYLFQRGSSESKPIDEPASQDEDPRDARDRPGVPWPVRRGGWVLKAYETSLSALFFVLFVGSLVMHALGGASAYSAEEMVHVEHQ